jgi:hypothetical protein
MSEEELNYSLSNLFIESTDKNDLKKYQNDIYQKIAQLNDFKSRIEENTTVPSEIKIKYTQSIQLLINRLNGYLIEIQDSLGKVDQIRALEESISKESAELEKLREQSKSTSATIESLEFQLRAL